MFHCCRIILWWLWTLCFRLSHHSQHIKNPTCKLVSAYSSQVSWSLLPYTCLSGKVLSVSNLLLVSPPQIAKQCRITLSETQSIIDIVCKEHAQQPRSLIGVESKDDEMFTTGDAELDHALGGGIRTGMVWEVAGERYLFIYSTDPFRDPEQTIVLLGRHSSVSSAHWLYSYLKTKEGRQAPHAILLLPRNYPQPA